jgi:hypothetical protein
MRKWRFIIRDHLLQVVGLIEDALSWDAARAENDRGSFTLILPPTYPLTLFEVDHIIEFYRSDDDGRSWNLDGETCWFVRDAYFSWDGGKETIEVSGHDTIGLLERRIVAWYAVANTELAQNYYSKKFGPADKALWELFHENFGVGVLGQLEGDVPASVAGDATTVYRAAVRQMAYVTQDPVRAEGPLVTAEFAWKPVLTAMKDIVRAAAQEGTRLIFDIVYTPDSETPFVFRIWHTLRGVDRSRGEQRIIFSRRHDNVASISLRNIHSDEATWIHVGGPGQASLRIMQGVAQPVPFFQRSPFYPIEGFVENTKTADQATLISTGKAELYRRRARFEFSGEAKDGPLTTFGRTYRYGDRVLCEHRGVFGVCRISRYRTTVSGGREVVNVPFETEESEEVE